MHPEVAAPAVRLGAAVAVAPEENPRGRGTRPATSVGPGRATKPIPITPATPLLRLALPSQLATGWQAITRNGYKFEIDSAQRTRRISGAITLNPSKPRSRQTQARAGGTDRLLTDDGGHYIARQFNGPTDAFNHFAQDAGFNRGVYRVLEGRWAKARLQGKLVSVDITPSYNGTSTRPTSVTVDYRVGSAEYTHIFANKVKVKRDD